ncbi:MAG: hypothetical protein AAF846_16860 [Chloroflexota bacterium]
MFFILGGNETNLLYPNEFDLLTLFTEFPTNITPVFDIQVGAGTNFPAYLLQDEITHYFYARNIFSGNPTQFIQLALDEWGRPGNTLTYALPSALGFMLRRWLSVILLILTTVETIWIFQALSRSKKTSEIKRGVKWFSYIAIPLLLWSQPWFFYYGVQSLTQVPFMYFLTAGVSAWLFGRYRRATFFFSLMPITRHESLPLLLIWLVYLYRREITNFVLDNLNGVLDLNLKQPDDLPKNPKQDYLNNRWKLLLITISPYLTWNFGSLAFRNGSPAQSLIDSQGEIAYEAQNFELFFIGASEWMGPWVLVLFISSIVLSAMLGYIHWTYITAIRPHKIDDRNPIEEIKKHPIIGLLKQRDAHKTTTPLSRYTWWLFYLGYFLIHVFLTIGPGNPFASGGYDFFILPIAPALAVIASLFLALMVGAWRERNQSDDNSIPEARNQFYQDIDEALRYFQKKKDSDNTINNPDRDEEKKETGYEDDLENSINNPNDPNSFLKNRTHGGARFLARFSVRSSAWLIVIILLLVFINNNVQIWLDPEQDSWNSFGAWLPEGQELTAFDGTNIRQDAGERQAIVNQIEGIITLISNGSFWLPERDAENVTNYVPFVLTTNSALRLAIEQASTTEDDDSDILTINNTTFRLCPHTLWDVTPQLPLYPNLLPDGTVIIADGQPDAGFQTNYMVMPEQNDGYRIEVHHLNTMFDEYDGYFGSWARSEIDDDDNEMDKVNVINLEVNPTNNENLGIPRFWINYGFAIYRLDATTTSNTNDALLNEDLMWRRAYAERYCGYAESERFAEVTAHYQPVYRNIGNIFPNSDDALSSLELPGNAVVPLLDNCTIQDASDNLEGCEISLADISYILTEDDELQVINPDNQVAENEEETANNEVVASSSSPLFVPPDSVMPVLYCQRLDNRLQASWCLTVFGDTAFAIDAESELSYTSNTLNGNINDVCNFERQPSTEGTWDERIVLPDVNDDLLIRALRNTNEEDEDNNTVMNADELESFVSDQSQWRELGERVYILREDELLYAGYDFTPRWFNRHGSNDNNQRGEAYPIAEESPIITMPGCFGWILVYRPGSQVLGRSTNALLLDETLDDLRLDQFFNSSSELQELLGD